ncbi:hypothetical protein F511_30448 [Dorcoceras hygrometricum]|uniref:Uncharacterized protein n=1 Tax=Dorcoceras hygrometricum TaxID=472368 RepID=A0A2Z7C4B2_9LAMI|nr:hypothetical protein F511_30448 [Dorcoceras hygrometricum]
MAGSQNGVAPTYTNDVAQDTQSYIPTAGHPVAGPKQRTMISSTGHTVATSKRSVATYSNDVAPLTSLSSRNISPNTSRKATMTLTRVDHCSRLIIQTQQLLAKYQSQLQCTTSRNIRNTTSRKLQ